ncbi:MAG: hypothetical protein U9M89_02545, partial [Patescibacteria group bacterium]|nr:hypothetical protein [Patescibacteria group bacterium]
MKDMINLSKKTIITAIIFLIFILMPSISYALTDISVSDIEITPKNILSDEITHITVNFDTETSEDESKVTLSFYIDGNLEKKVTRYYSEKSYSYTYSYDTEDLSIGAHTVEVIANIYRGTSIIKATDSATKIFYIEEPAQKIDLTMNIYPKYAETDKNIRVFGYVDPTDEVIDIFVDGIPKRTTISDVNGYYSTFIKIKAKGTHIITASVYDSKKHETVNIIEKAEEKELDKETE